MFYGSPVVINSFVRPSFIFVVADLGHFVDVLNKGKPLIISTIPLLIKPLH